MTHINLLFTTVRSTVIESKLNNDRTRSKCEMLFFNFRVGHVIIAILVAN